MASNGNATQWQFQAAALPSSIKMKQQQEQVAVLLEMMVPAAKTTTASSSTIMKNNINTTINLQGNRWGNTVVATSAETLRNSSNAANNSAS